MNPKAEGALEALSYVQEFLKTHGESRTVKEIESLIDGLLRGIGVDFN
jgi:hypothetical protein